MVSHESTRFIPHICQCNTCADLMKSPRGEHTIVFRIGPFKWFEIIRHRFVFGFSWFSFCGWQVAVWLAVFRC